MTRTPAALLTLSVVLTAAPLAAQKPVTKMGTTATGTATIQAIDQTSRTITLRNEDGTEDAFYVPPAVSRFSELKVGDKIKARYYESYVFQVRKPGDTPTGKVGESVTRGTGASPSATLSQQMTTTVEVLKIDAAVPSITVKTADGRTVTRKIEDKKNIAGLKVGDKIDITYTQAAIIEVEPIKP